MLKTKIMVNAKQRIICPMPFIMLLATSTFQKETCLGEMMQQSVTDKIDHFYYGNKDKSSKCKNTVCENPHSNAKHFHYELYSSNLEY